MAKLTTADFIAKARLKHGDFYDYSSSIYAGAHTMLEIRCPLHGVFNQRAGDHANVGKGCRQCGVERATPERFSTEEFVKQARATHGDKYLYDDSIYVSYKKPVTIECRIHGKFEQQAGRHLRGNGCGKCRTGKKLCKSKALNRQQRREKWINDARAVHGDRYDYSEAEFKNSKTDVQIICPDHGSFLQQPGNHLRGGCKCPACAAEGKSALTTKSHEQWLEDFRRVHGALYDYAGSTPIKSAYDIVSIACAKHGVFEQRAYSHQYGHGCPKCVSHISKPEIALLDWLASVIPDVEILTNKRDVIPPHELDIYIPELKLALEFNGNYWHCDKHKSKLYHQSKSLACRALGITLLHIYEFDWVVRADACKKMIMSKLGVCCKKLNARALTLRPVDSCASFLAENHFQGNVQSSVRYGLFDGGELISLMTFGRSRFNKEHTWELLRFCTRHDTRVRGGASRLFTRFVRDHLNPGDTVVSYARLDYSVGGVYSALGFAYDGVCSPDYTWFKLPSQILKRQSTQKHKLSKLLGDKFSAELSESENMRAAGYKRVYSAGNLRYIYTHE